MPITYLTHSQRLPLSGSCNFNGCEERPKNASRLYALMAPRSCAMNLPAGELRIKRIPEASKRNAYAL